MAESVSRPAVPAAATSVARTASAGGPDADAGSVAAAYDFCWRVATSHYENFTVGSWLLPRRLRRHIAAIYAFARAADDMADEGDASPGERLARLDDWERKLLDCFAGKAVDPVFVALADTARRFDLPVDPFRDLLTAFRRDVEFRPFATFEDLRGYCRCSADPVGRLILYLFGYRDAERQDLSDRICTGLQLANFWQDIAVDAAKGRLYVPTDEIRELGCTEYEVTHGILTAPVRRLLAFEVERARELLSTGLRLAELVEGRLRREVKLFAWGGFAILRAIELADFDVFSRRPTVSSPAKAGLVLAALLGRTPRSIAAVPKRADGRAEPSGLCA
jgi:squalene synthase HpnC